MSAEAEIRGLVTAWTKAAHAKDVDAIMAFYAPGIVCFDLAPPLLHRRDDIRHGLKEWFATFTGPVEFEIRDLHVTASGDAAFSRSLNHLTGDRTSGERTDVWVRATICFERIEGAWKVVHEHVSVPFYMDGSYRASVDLKP
jgi:ketosteroid isomerase-like protein